MGNHFTGPNFGDHTSNNGNDSGPGQKSSMLFSFQANQASQAKGIGGDSSQDKLSSSTAITTAVVVENKGDPEKLGRVKLRFDRFKENENAQRTTDWIRVMQPFGKNEYGSWHTLDIGTRVVCACENNDLNNPIVIGTLYNNTNNKPPSIGDPGDLNKDGENNLQFLKTKGEHIVSFDSKPGEEKFTLQTKSKQLLEMDVKEKTILVSDSEGNKIEFGGKEKDIKITSGSGPTIILNKGGIEITADKDITVKGQNVTVDAKDALIKASSVKVNSGDVSLGIGARANLALADRIVAQFNAHIHPTGVGPSGPPVAPMTGINSSSVKVAD